MSFCIEAMPIRGIFRLGVVFWPRTAADRRACTRLRVAPKVSSPRRCRQGACHARRGVVVGLLLLVCGCATKKDMVATGGSRADGTVMLSYEIGSMQKAELDPGQGLTTARQRCQAWGYSDAEAFGGETRQCQAPSQYGCLQWLVSVNYQCLGAHKPA